MAITQHEKTLITRFVESELCVHIDSWPDESNRVTKDIDALAGGGRFAIELTSLDSIPNQRKRDAEFMRVVGDLEAELSPDMEYRLAVSIPVVAIQVGQDWAGAQENIKAWVLTEGPSLPYGRHPDTQIPGLPYLVNVTKADSPWKPKLVFRRHGTDQELQPDDAEVKKLIQGKASKLRRYSGRGKTTILLVESQDMALMSPQFFCELTSRLFAIGRPPGVDEIWFADCYVLDEIQFLKCL